MTPEAITLHKGAQKLELVFDGQSFHLDAEFLRVHSPSAEVRGHGPGQAVLQHGKQFVKMVSLSQVGHYAVQIRFDDDHDSGIYAWDYLYELCINRDTYWDDYLNALEDAGKRRDPGEQVIKLFDPAKN